MLFTNVKILNWDISTAIILYVFVAVAGLALILFVLNLIFSKPSDKKAKKNTVDAKAQEKRQLFDDQRKNIETEISLIIRTEKSKKEEQDESEEVQSQA